MKKISLFAILPFLMANHCQRHQNICCFDFAMSLFRYVKRRYPAGPPNADSKGLEAALEFAALQFQGEEVRVFGVASSAGSSMKI